MNNEFKCLPSVPAPDGWEYTGEIRQLQYGEAGRFVAAKGAIFEPRWNSPQHSNAYAWIAVPSYSKSVDIYGATVTVEDVYGTMNPVIPKGWKVRRFAVPTKDDLETAFLYTTGSGGYAFLKDWTNKLAKNYGGVVTIQPLLLLERAA